MCSSQGWAPRVLPFLLLFIIACLLMFVYVWVGLGFFLSLLTSSYDAMSMFFMQISLYRSWGIFGALCQLTSKLLTELKKGSMESTKIASTLVQPRFI